MTETARSRRFSTSAVSAAVIVVWISSFAAVGQSEAQWQRRGYAFQPRPQVAQSLPAPVLPPPSYFSDGVPLDGVLLESVPFDNGVIMPQPPASVAPILPSIDQYQTWRVPSASPSFSFMSDAEKSSAVRIAISSPLLSAIFRRASSQSGPVDDCVLGAKVTGQQQTQTRTALRLVPNANKAAFEIVLSGRTLSDTFGATSIAGIVSSTNSQFEMTKPFSFDGQQFMTSTPGAVVWPQQTNKAAVALRGNVPILRRVIGSFAYQEAERRRPQSEQITAKRVTQDASGRFNGRVDEALEKLQSDWSNKVVATAAKYLPNLDFPTARTTSDHAIFTLPSPWAAAENDQLPAAWTTTGNAISFAVHESALLAGIERLQLGGFTIGPGDWDQAVRNVLPNIVDGGEPIFGAQTGALVLSQNNPARVKFRDNQVVVVLTAKVSTPVGELPPQRITLPWTVRIADTTVYAEPGEPVVEAATSDDNAMMAMVRAFMVTQLKTEVLPLKFPRSITRPLGADNDAKSVTATFASMVSEDGWLRLGWDATVSE